ncbi:MAG: GIY-YIG nuclease family protein [Bacteriovoracaceae bacterium]|nr:GIY-YIG nuclease family protein [Bacteriovoracaceae bacterium]
MSDWFLYIIETEDGKLYTGITTDVDRRFQEHCGKKKGAKFFRSSIPKQIVYREKVENRSIASKREARIKKLTRANKIKLINGEVGELF